MNPHPIRTAATARDIHKRRFFRILTPPLPMSEVFYTYRLASFNQLLTPPLLIADVLYGRPLGRASTDQLDISSMLMATVCTAGILHPGGHE